MDLLTQSPAFPVYCLNAAALCLNLMGLWAYSGVVRSGTKTTLNTEDAASVVRGAEVVAVDPPPVARVLRAHANAMAGIVPFLALALLYVLLGASARMAWMLFGGFTFCRWLHSITYVAGKQPWRTISFALGGLATLVVLEEVARLSIALL